MFFPLLLALSQPIRRATFHCGRKGTASGWRLRDRQADAQCVPARKPNGTATLSAPAAATRAGDGSRGEADREFRPGQRDCVHSEVPREQGRPARFSTRRCPVHSGRFASCVQAKDYDIDPSGSASGASPPAGTRQHSTTHFDALLKDGDDIDKMSCRPDAILACSHTMVRCHARQLRTNLLGRQPRREAGRTLLEREAGDEGHATDIHFPHVRRQGRCRRTQCGSTSHARPRRCPSKCIYEKGSTGRPGTRQQSGQAWPDRLTDWMKTRDLLGKVEVRLVV